jgi:response regulator RpfG family c-di-GMP phosphodiesterase
MRPQILCIDDDPDVLDGLELVLHGVGEIHLAESGAAALDLSARLPRLAVVVCDMRMPVRNGAQVLEDFHRLRPDAVRILLTGYTDVGDAIAAINQGQIFRFLTKPCEPAVLQRTLGEALRQHQLVCAERELLEQTLKGCLDAMTDALALASPGVFGHAQRVRSLCAEVARQSGTGSHWSLEIAAMLLHIGLVGLPEEVLAPLLKGDAPEARHREQVRQAFAHAMETLQRIPRMEGVRDIIRLAEPMSGGNLEIPLERSEQTRAWSAILRLCRQYVRLEALGYPPAAAIAKLQTDGSPEPLLAALGAAVGDSGAEEEFREVGLAALQAGMVLAKPLFTQAGQLLAPAGYEIREGFARRLADLRPEMRHARFQVLVRKARKPTAAESSDEESSTEG